MEEFCTQREAGIDDTKSSLLIRQLTWTVMVAAGASLLYACCLVSYYWCGKRSGWSWNGIAVAMEGRACMSSYNQQMLS